MARRQMMRYEPVGDFLSAAEPTNELCPSAHYVDAQRRECKKVGQQITVDGRERK